MSTNAPTNAIAPVAQGGMTTRDGLDGTSISTSGETAASMIAARASANAQARFLMAMKNPRDMDFVRQKMLKAVERPGFAHDGWYIKPVGDGVEGFSIRFAEEAIRCLGNIDVQQNTLWDDHQRRVIEVIVTDLENNITYPMSVTVEKIVERKKLKRGETALRVRTNSYGDPLYILPATEDEVLQKQQSLVSKAIRNGALRLLPGDIQAECKTRMEKIRAGARPADPEAFKRQVLDSFATINVTVPMIELYLGQPVAAVSPKQVEALQALFREINTGRTTWADVLREMDSDADGDQKPEPEKKPAPAGPAANLDAATEALRARNTKAQEATTAAPGLSDVERAEFERLKAKFASQQDPPPPAATTAAPTGEASAPTSAQAPTPSTQKAPEPPREVPLEEDPLMKRMRARGQGTLNAE